MKINPKEVLQEKLAQYIRPMCMAYLYQSDKDPIEFMINWLQTEGKKVKEKEKTINEQKQIGNKIKDTLEKIDESISKLKESDSDNEEQPSNTQESESDLDLDPKMVEKMNKRMSVRTSKKGISAEVYGIYNKPQDFKGRVVPKTQEQQQQIKDILKKSFMFSGLNPQDLTTIIQAMEIKNFDPEQKVIKQGDDGHELFIVSEGKLQCSKIFSGNTQETFLRNYKPGEVFGELSLFYNTPRAATIQAIDKSTCFSLDRETFNAIVKNSAVQRRQKFEEFLGKIEIFKSLDEYERNKLSDVLIPQQFFRGDYIIHEGEVADKFYLILSGQAEATKIIENKEQVVFRYNSTQDIQYFGELALLNNNKRNASIRVISDEMQVVYLEKEAFENLIGNIRDILMRNQDQYELFQNKLDNQEIQNQVIMQQEIEQQRDFKVISKLVLSILLFVSIYMSQKTKKFSIGQIGKPFCWYFGLKLFFNIYKQVRNKKIMASLSQAKDIFWLLYFLIVELTAKQFLDKNKLALFTLPMILIDIVPFIINIDKSVMNRISKIYSLFFSIQMFFISLIITQKIDLINKEISLAVMIADGFFQMVLVLVYLSLFLALPIGLFIKKQLANEVTNLSYLCINLLFLVFKSIQKALIITYIWLMIEFELINISQTIKINGNMLFKVSITFFIESIFYTYYLYSKNNPILIKIDSIFISNEYPFFNPNLIQKFNDLKK